MEITIILTLTTYDVSSNFLHSMYERFPGLIGQILFHARTHPDVHR